MFNGVVIQTVNLLLLYTFLSSFCTRLNIQFNQLQVPLKLFFTRHPTDNRPYQSTRHLRRKCRDCADCHRQTSNRRPLAAFVYASCDDFGTKLLPKREKKTVNI